MTHKVFISLGSNHDRENNLLTALDALREQFGELMLSSVYETAAMGNTTAENYYNLVVRISTYLSPEHIMSCLKEIEAETEPRRGKVCPLDLDLLLYGELINHENGLDIPRKDILEFAYVAMPLAEINGDQIHPETNKTFQEHSLAEHISNQSVQRTTLEKGTTHATQSL